MYVRNQSSNFLGHSKMSIIMFDIIECTHFLLTLSTGVYCHKFKLSLFNNQTLNFSAFFIFLNTLLLSLTLSRWFLNTFKHCHFPHRSHLHQHHNHHIIITMVFILVTVSSSSSSALLLSIRHHYHIIIIIIMTIITVVRVIIITIIIF